MSLFSTYQLGSLQLKNRLVMSPMTRCRALGNLANPLMAEYYAQRASAGLIITEGTSPSPNGLGYARIPGIFSVAQTTSWKQVTSAVHARGGKIFIQLMHSGRVSQAANLPAGVEVLAPSALTLDGKMWTDAQGELPHSTPRAMTIAEIELAIDEYRLAAQNAIKAGFDGVELHGANGYLIDQFINPTTNQRDDDYGGDVQRRNHFALAVASVVTKEIGAQKTGIRLSPHGIFNGMADFPELAEQYAALSTGLGKLGLAYIHLVDHSALGAPKPLATTIDKIRNNYRAAGKGAIILSGGYDRERATADLKNKQADLIAFGRPFISNPDLPARIKQGAKLAEANMASFYTPGAAGYTDYPLLN